MSKLDINAILLKNTVMDKLINKIGLDKKEMKYLEEHMKRKCRKCNKSKVYGDFYKSKTGRAGHDSDCKECKKKIIVKLNRQRREKLREAEKTLNKILAEKKEKLTKNP